jgi:hypothetical protein
MRHGEYVLGRVAELGRVSVWIVNGLIRVLKSGSDREQMMFFDPALLHMCVGTYDANADAARINEDVSATTSASPLVETEAV